MTEQSNLWNICKECREVKKEYASLIEKPEYFGKEMGEFEKNQENLQKRYATILLKDMTQSNLSHFVDMVHKCFRECEYSIKTK